MKKSLIVILFFFFIIPGFSQGVSDSGNAGNTYAVVAGGSKGIGYSIASALAKRNYNLLLIARNKVDLGNAKQKLEQEYKVKVDTLSCDLSQEESAERIAGWCTQNNIQVKVLCNVAGFGGTNDFLSLSLDSLRYMVRLNVESAMALSLTLLPLLEKNAPAYILNVSSMAGFSPIPIKNMYAASKSALIFFSYGLRYQLKSKRISVSCLAPGPVFTKPEIEKDTKEKLGWLGMQMAISPERVGEVAIRKTLKGKLLIVPGTLANISAFFVRTLPRSLVTALFNKAGGK